MTVIFSLAMVVWCLFCGPWGAYCARHQYMDIDHFCMDCGHHVAHKVHDRDAMPILRSTGLEQPSEHAPLDEASLMQPIRPAETPSGPAMSAPTGVANFQRPVQTSSSSQYILATQAQRPNFEQPNHFADSQLKSQAIHAVD